MSKNDVDKTEGLPRTGNSGEIINTNTNINTFDSKDSLDEQVDEDIVLVNLREFKAEYTRDKDKFDVIKFTIK